MLECYVTYDLINQQLPWKECIRLAQWFRSKDEAGEFIYARRKDTTWELVEVGLPTTLSMAYGMPYMRFVNTPRYHLNVGGQCLKCEQRPEGAVEYTSTCSKEVVI